MLGLQRTFSNLDHLLEEVMAKSLAHSVSEGTRHDELHHNIKGIANHQAWSVQQVRKQHGYLVYLPELCLQLMPSMQ